VLPCSLIPNALSVWGWLSQAAVVAAACVCAELDMEEVASLRLIWRGEQDEKKNCPYDWLGEWL